MAARVRSETGEAEDESGPPLVQAPATGPPAVPNTPPSPNLASISLAAKYLKTKKKKKNFRGQLMLLFLFG